MRQAGELTIFLAWPNPIFYHILNASKSPPKLGKHPGFPEKSASPKDAWLHFKAKTAAFEVAVLVISSGDWDKKWRKCTIMALLGLTTAEREIDLKRQSEEIPDLVFLDQNGSSYSRRVPL